MKPYCNMLPIFLSKTQNAHSSSVHIYNIHIRWLKSSEQMLCGTKYLMPLNWNIIFESFSNLLAIISHNCKSLHNAVNVVCLVHHVRAAFLICFWPAHSNGSAVCCQSKPTSTRWLILSCTMQLNRFLSLWIF